MPIRLIPFGGVPVESQYINQEVEIFPLDRFPVSAFELIDELCKVTECPPGFLYRYLAWFGDWDEFIYSDNDIVALCNWETMFDYLENFDFVHADQEYITKGKYNYDQPEQIDKSFGVGSLETAFTAGHFAARRNEKFVSDIIQAIEWFHTNPAIPKKHDQSLMHIASLIGKWNMLNLCKPPHNWLSSWAGDYTHTLALVHAIQKGNVHNKISHIHYSGSTPSGTHPIHDFLFASGGHEKRLRSMIINGSKDLTGLSSFLSKKNRVMNRLKRMVNRKPVS